MTIKISIEGTNKELGDGVADLYDIACCSNRDILENIRVYTGLKIDYNMEISVNTERYKVMLVDSNIHD